MRLASVTKEGDNDVADGEIAVRGNGADLGDHFAGNRLGHLLDFGNGNFDGLFGTAFQERELQDNGNRRFA